METYIRHWDYALSEADCDRVIAKFDEIESNSYISANVIADGASQYGGALARKDFSLFFDQVAREESKFIHSVVGQRMEEYKKEFMGLEGMGGIVSYSCKVQRTPPKGGFHNWHSEHGPTLGSFRRVAVWLLYLTTHDESGDTEFIQQGIKFKPKKGTLVIWPAAFTHPHRGNPVYDKDKYIATGWFEFHEQPYINEV